MIQNVGKESPHGVRRHVLALVESSNCVEEVIRLRRR